MAHRLQLPASLAALIILMAFTLPSAIAQTPVKYTGNTLANPDYHHGELAPVVGVHNIQVMRASREHPDSAEGFGWTYNHAPNLACWNGKFYLQWLSNPVGEHVPPGQVLLTSSQDGYHWEFPRQLFPPYHIPDGTTKEGHAAVAKNLKAVVHQRMGFFVSSNHRLLTLGYYGIVLDDDDSPKDGHGIGRAVREIYKDSSLGPIHFIHYNSAWNEDNTYYPFYKSSGDTGFVAACDELLSNPLMVQQWVEESDRGDPLIPLPNADLEAFSFYHLNDGRVVGLWKYALSAVSTDNGRTWSNPVHAAGFVNKNAKIWGQKTSDGRFVTVYNPSMFRWPLAVSVSEDGIDYTNLLLVNGQITTGRYGGEDKQYGPQYVRGILEGNGTPPDGDLWVTYSMNKEDIWVADIPVPIRGAVTEQVNDVFQEMPDGHELDQWNLFMPQWAPVKIEKRGDGAKWLALHDWDTFDYAVAERVIPSSKQLTAEFVVEAGQNDHGELQIEFQNTHGNAGIRLTMNEQGQFLNKAGYNYDHMLQYEPGKTYDVRVELNTETNRYDVYINGKREAGRQFFAPLHEVSRVVFRTGKRRYFPTVDSPRAHETDLPDAGALIRPAVWYLQYLKTSSQ